MLKFAALENNTPLVENMPNTTIMPVDCCIEQANETEASDEKIGKCKPFHELLIAHLMLTLSQPLSP